MLPPGSATETDEHVLQIERCARSQCSLEETAAYLRLAPTEFVAFLAVNARSAKAWFGGPAAGRAELRMYQFDAAKDGDSRLLVWLGKNVLGQSDKLPTATGELPKAASDPWENLSSWRMQRLG